MTALSLRRLSSLLPPTSSHDSSTSTCTALMEQCMALSITRSPTSMSVTLSLAQIHVTQSIWATQWTCAGMIPQALDFGVVCAFSCYNAAAHLCKKFDVNNHYAWKHLKGEIYDVWHHLLDPFVFVIPDIRTTGSLHGPKHRMSSPSSSGLSWQPASPLSSSFRFATTRGCYLQAEPTNLHKGLSG